jgi:hypothetical protein
VLKGPTRAKITLGHYPSISLQDARKKAIIALGSPYAPSHAPSFVEARQKNYLDAQISRLRPSSLRETKRTLIRYFHWTKPDDKITHNDVAGVLETIEAPRERSHTQKDITTFFNWCIPRYVQHSPCQGLRKAP